MISRYDKRVLRPRISDRTLRQKLLAIVKSNRAAPVEMVAIGVKLLRNHGPEGQILLDDILRDPDGFLEGD